MIKDDEKNKIENAKNFMASAIKLATYIENLQTRLVQLETKAQNIGSSDNSELGTRILSGMHNTDNLYCTIVMVKDSIAKNLLIFEERYQKIQKILLDIATPELQMILDCRYLQGKQWNEIALELGYCERTLYRLHKKALLEVSRILEAE